MAAKDNLLWIDSRGYTLASFRETLHSFCTTAGVECQPIAFLMSDSQIVDEGMHEDTCNLLNTGDVPNLFAHKEEDKIINQLRRAAAIGFGSCML